MATDLFWVYPCRALDPSSRLDLDYYGDDHRAAFAVLVDQSSDGVVEVLLDQVGIRKLATDPQF